MEVTLHAVDLDKFREQRRIENISNAFKEAAELALSDWDTTVIVGAVGDDVHVVFPDEVNKFELIGMLLDAIMKLGNPPTDGESA
jgi:hypothetical protein